jgi:hypothetical protein
LVKLYDLGSDPEELVDLSAVELEITQTLLDELKASLSEADRPYL